MGKRSAEDSAVDASMNESAAMDTIATGKDEYEHLCTLVNAIAKPLASRKLAKKLYKLVKKSSKEQHYLRDGLKDVQKAIRKNEKGIMVLAGNVSPIDVYSHLPGLCEDNEIPYCYVPSREQLGLAAGRLRPSIVVYIKPHADYQELYDEVYEAVNALVVD